MPRSQRKGNTSRSQKSKRTSGAGAKGLALAGVNLASSTHKYLLRTLELGVLEGALGKMNINPSLRPVIEALHHVLAGGKVELHVTQPGNPDIRKELQNHFKQGIQEANAINRRAGYRIIVEI